MDFDFSNLVVHPPDFADLEMDFESDSEDDAINLQVHPQDVMDLELNPADFRIMDLEMESPNFEIEMVYESGSDLDMDDDGMEQESDEENSWSTMGNIGEDSSDSGESPEISDEEDCEPPLKRRRRNGEEEQE